MLVMMAVSLFTFRELLRLLGVDDYGTYNVVGGVIILFSFLSNAMTQSNQRFLSYHIGKGDKGELKHIFSMIINVQILLAGIILVLAETLGLWFINTQLNFSQENMFAVNWVYQFSILTFIIQILQIPYTSAIISHERMDFFSYVSIGEAFIRLGVVLALSFFSSGRLIIYAILLSVSALIMFVVNYVYCTRTFTICKYQRHWDNSQFKILTSFSGWNMLGGLGVVCNGQGINILFNIFCGVVANAAMGISHQVSSAVGAFVGNMQMAFNPQIVKSYAANDIPYFNSLIFRASRISFFLILIIGLPVIICTKQLLELWLDEIPDYAISFAQLSILYSMVDALSGALWVGTQATGNIKWYTIILTLFLFLNLPIGYFLLKCGMSPNTVLTARLIICFSIHLFRIIYLHRIAAFPAWMFLKDVTFKAIMSLGISVIFPFILCPLLVGKYAYIPILILTFIETFVIGFYILLQKNERVFIINKCRSISSKIFKCSQGI